MRATDKQRGFTLLEIMVVIVIIGVLASLVVPNLMGNKERRISKKPSAILWRWKTPLICTKLDNHHYPTTNQGLESLVEAPTLPPLAANYNKEGYIKRLPADPWGNDYVLVNPGEHGAYDLLSAGPDGEMGTEDDITNWGLSKKKK
ncbi:type II secretion system major pseudopilin GspG [Flavobacterium paronense]|nr:type II secretion system major pseudopilin GspG [Flavobacterium paronense]MDN3675942.1 type II secretion system major pseudopilin GspG [Flavobacterium paronense]